MCQIIAELCVTEFDLLPQKPGQCQRQRQPSPAKMNLRLQTVLAVLYFESCQVAQV